MAPKKKTPEELIPLEENAAFVSEEEPVAAVVGSGGMEDMDTQDELNEEPIEIPDLQTEEPAPALSSVSRQTTSVKANAEGSSAIGVAREALSAGRTALWDVEQEDRTTVGIFLTALKEKRILEGNIAGVEVNRRMAYWVLYEGPVTVRIPFDNSFMQIPADLANKRPSEDILRRQRQMLERAMGATINFTVSRFEPDGDGTYLAIGSRTDAMDKIRKVYFGHNAAQKLSVGDDVVAQIITHGKHAAYLNFCGIDVKVKKSDLSHRYIEDVSASFHVGERIRVRLMNIQMPEESVGIPAISVSAKPIEKARFDRNLRRIHKNGYYIGTVTSTNLKGSGNGDNVTISLFLNDVEVPAFSRTPILALGDALHNGDQVSFMALGVNEDGFAHGKILEVIKPRI